MTLRWTMSKYSQQTMGILTPVHVRVVYTDEDRAFPFSNFIVLNSRPIRRYTPHPTDEDTDIQELRITP